MQIPTDAGDVDIHKVSEEFPFTKKGSKYFVAYQSNEDVTPLLTLLSKISRYIKKVLAILRHLFFENLLTKYCEISSEILKTMKMKIFHGDPVFVEKHYED